MLISFTLGNWRSFGEKTSLSLLPTHERRFAWTLPVFGDAPKKLLPISVLYGANASGKTNFFGALSFLSDYVANGVPEDSRIPIQPNRLDGRPDNEPSFFSIAFRAGENIYEYTLALSSSEVEFEQLTEFGHKRREKVLFKREAGRLVELAANLRKDNRARFVFDGTQDNLAFLTNAYRQKLQFAVQPYRWLRDSLFFIGTDSCYLASHIFDNGNPFQRAIGECLSRYDTGINGLEATEKPYDAQSFDVHGLAGLAGKKCVLFQNRQGRYRIAEKDGNLVLSVLNSLHMTAAGSRINFDFNEESDGTQRLLDLLPALIMCRDEPAVDRVFIVDEIDRSLHPNLLRLLITEYLQACSGTSRFQLIATTHNTDIMDQDLLRRDEMWIIGREQSGSILQSLSDFKHLRFDTVLERLYKQGRFGGVPRIVIPALPVSRCSTRCTQEQEGI